jgi:beta-lactamase regulating signal transducer with metallopeptidase domain
MNGQSLAAIESFAEIWAEWMAEMAFQVVVLTVAVTVLAWLCGKRSASFRYALWMVVLVRLAIPPSLSLPTGWGWWLRDEAVAQNTSSPSPVQLRQTPKRVSAPEVDQPSPERVPADASPAVADIAPPATEVSAPASTLAPPSAAPEPTALRPSWSALLLLGWAGVSTTLLGLLVLGAVRTRQWVRNASRELDPRLLRILGRARWRLEFTRDVELRNSENCTTPLVVGWWRPVILLPASVTRELDDDELEAVVLHELNHILRRDALANFAQAVMGSIYFFHPLVWWTNREIRRLREDACDEMTVAAMEGRRKAYGSALVKVSEILGYAAPPLALGVMESKHPAKRRLGRILDPKLPLADRWSWLSLALVSVLAIVFLPGGPRPAASLADDLPAGVAQNDANRGDAAEPPAPLIGETGAPVGDAAVQPEELPPALTPPVLRYGFKPGQSVAYSIHIEGEDAEGTETRYGNVSYNVRAADKQRVTLAVFGITHGFRRSHPGAGFGPRRRPFDFYSPFETGGPGALSQERLLTIDSRGSVESIRGSIPLPFALGDLASLAILPLPADDSREWVVDGPVRIELESHDDPIPRSPIFRQAPEVLEARASNHYRLASWSGQRAVIERQLDSATVQQINGRPRLEITGGGEAVFDLAGGVLDSLQWDLTLTANDAFVSRETNVKVICKRVQPGAAAPLADAPIQQIDMAQAVADFDSPEQERVLIALRVVRDTEPNADRAAIAARLREFLTHSDNSIRDAAAAAFGRWSGEEDVETLIGLLENESTSIRWAAMDALGRLKAEAAVAPIAARLSVGIDRVTAGRALTSIGSASELAVLPLLDSSEWPARMTVVNLLRDIGGEASLGPLAKLAESDPESNVRTWANIAIESIQKRQSQ